MDLISAEQALEMDATCIDVRSPAEFEEDHIPGAINIPIFSNQERHEVGLLYKQSPQQAFDLGVELYGKKLGDITNKIRMCPRNKPLIVYCWRGGMRSKAIAQIADLIGYDVKRIEGGYKAYRKVVREALYENDYKCRFIVLQGLTGSGKTKLIENLPWAIDLEGCAQHRSSRFGEIARKPNSQKMFESLLYNQLELLKDQSSLFVEGESRKIGPIVLPPKIYEKMKEGVMIEIQATDDQRVARIVNDYFSHGEDEKIADIIKGMSKVISKKQLGKYLQLLEQKNYTELSRLLLTEFYDQRYKHAVKGIQYLAKIKHEDTQAAVKELLKIRGKIAKHK